MTDTVYAPTGVSAPLHRAVCGSVLAPEDFRKKQEKGGRKVCECGRRFTTQALLDQHIRANRIR